MRGGKGGTKFPKNLIRAFGILGALKTSPKEKKDRSPGKDFRGGEVWKLKRDFKWDTAATRCGNKADGKGGYMFRKKHGT